jgi:nucleoside-diphosphate-sugar epimerase
VWYNYIKEEMKTVLITGAAGNLGSLLAEHMKEDVKLHLMYHRKKPKPEISSHPNVNLFQADLAEPESLYECMKGVDVVVHFAGVLFKHHPEKFLPKTNTTYFRNLVAVAQECGVKRIILISFPHVEGETFPEKPATGRLDGNPTSVHAKTRLEEEKVMFASDQGNIETISLRVGMVYGKGILMIDAARRFAKYRILGIWKQPTWIHLISTHDFLESTKQAILKDHIKGIYHLGDDGVQTLQEFLDAATQFWGYPKPKRMPIRLIMAAADLFEIASFLFRTKSPLTRDFVRIGSVSYYGDTKKAREELYDTFKYKTFREGIDTL